MGLVITRNVDDAVAIGDSIRITVTRISGNEVRLLIEAPPEVTVHREEVYRRILAEGHTPPPLAVAHRLAGRRLVQRGGRP